jgi:hypothetical protein
LPPFGARVVVLVPLNNHQQVQDFALTVNRTPEPEPLSHDGHDYLVQVPATRRTRSSSTQFVSKPRPELGDPATDALIGDVEPSFRREILDVAVTQGEAKVRPHGVLNDGGRRK